MSVYTAVIISISRKVEVSQKQRCQYLIHMGQNIVWWSYETISVTKAIWL